MSDIRKKERINSKSDFKDRTVIMVEKRTKMQDFLHILIKNDAKQQQPIIVFDIFRTLLHKSFAHTLYLTLGGGGQEGANFKKRESPLF